MTGILSNQDILFLEAQAPKATDSLETVIAKADQIRNRVAGSIKNRMPIDNAYFNMEPFADLAESVIAQGEQTPQDFVTRLGEIDLKLD